MTHAIYPVPGDWKKTAHINAETYEKLFQRAQSEPEKFWAEQAQRISWIKPFTKVKETSFDLHNVSINWFADGSTNVSMNCIDRHLSQRAHQPAIIWESDDPALSRTFTYAQLHEEVCLFANVLKRHGVSKGDRVTIYLPMIPQAAFAMLACARIGAIHSVVFGGFSAEALAGRIEDASSALIITADEGVRAGRRIPLKANVDAAIDKLPPSQSRSEEHTSELQSH